MQFETGDDLMADSACPRAGAGVCVAPGGGGKNERRNPTADQPLHCIVSLSGHQRMGVSYAGPFH